jgi:hypothetical protein
MESSTVQGRQGKLSRTSRSQNEPLQTLKWLFNACSGLLSVPSGMLTLGLGLLTYSSGQSSSSSGPKAELENAHVDIPM